MEKSKTSHCLGFGPAICAPSTLPQNMQRSRIPFIKKDVPYISIVSLGLLDYLWLRIDEAPHVWAKEDAGKDAPTRW